MRHGDVGRCISLPDRGDARGFFRLIIIRGVVGAGISISTGADGANFRGEGAGSNFWGQHTVGICAGPFSKGSIIPSGFVPKLFARGSAGSKFLGSY